MSLFYFIFLSPHLCNVLLGLFIHFQNIFIYIYLCLHLKTIFWSYIHSWHFFRNRLDDTHLLVECIWRAHVYCIPWVSPCLALIPEGQLGWVWKSCFIFALVLENIVLLLSCVICFWEVWRPSNFLALISYLIFSPLDPDFSLFLKSNSFNRVCLRVGRWGSIFQDIW